MEKLSRILLVTTLVVGFVGCGDSEENVEKSKVVQEDKTQTITVKEQMAEMGKALKEGQEKIAANPNMSKEEQEKVIVNAIANSKGMQSQFEKMKKGMPKMVEAMKFGKKCLTKADSKSEAKTCMDKTEAMIKEIGFNDHDEEELEDQDFTWSPEDKKQMLADINKGLSEMEGRLPCIEKSKNMMEMMSCNQQ